MAWYDKKPAPRSETEAILRRIENLERRMRLKEQTAPTSLQLIDFEDYEDDLDNVDIGELHINWPGVHKVASRADPIVYFHDGEWRSLAAGGSAIYAIEVFENDRSVVVGDDAFNWEIPEDLDGAKLLKVEGYVNTPSGSGSVQVMVAKDGQGDVLLNKITIEPGDLNSKDAAVQPTVNPAEDDVEWGDHYRIDVDSAGGGTMGLGVILYFTPAETKTLAVEGAKGDPGGIANFAGQYSGVATYETGEAVNYQGSSYVAITNVTAGIIPGVTPGWEAFWMPLFDGQQYTTMSLGINNQGRILDAGPKRIVDVQFPCTIEQYTLYTDVATTMTWDIRKDTHGNYPPTAGDSIVGASPPQLIAANKAVDTALAGWNKNIAAGDVLTFHLVSNNLATMVNLTLKLARI